MPEPRRWGLSAEEWARAVADVRSALVEAGRSRRTVTYGDLARATGDRVQARAGALMQLLDEACDPLDQQTGAVCASLVVRADSGLPGEGYFVWAARTGRDVTDHGRLWRTEVELVWDAFSSSQELS